MIEVNEYFNGCVKSMKLQADGGPATIGVIAPGEYEFGTTTKEIMTVVSGDLDVMLPDSPKWKMFSKGQTFIVEKGKKFKVKTADDVSYLCLYR
jgi:purine/pyrimidine-nucleoside phosphorylase